MPASTPASRSPSNETCSPGATRRSTGYMGMLHSPNGPPAARSCPVSSPRRTRSSRSRGAHTSDWTSAAASTGQGSPGSSLGVSSRPRTQLSLARSTNRRPGPQSPPPSPSARMLRRDAEGMPHLCQIAGPEGHACGHSRSRRRRRPAPTPAQRTHKTAYRPLELLVHGRQIRQICVPPLTADRGRGEPADAGVHGQPGGVSVREGG
jgi:hypothetical protein